MASTELLASKVVILEEEPNIPAITALPSAVLLACGITERGPIADRTLLTSFDEYNRVYGGFTLDSPVAIAMYGFFGQGGSFAWVSRTCHFTDLTDPTTYTAAKGSTMLQTSGTAATPAVVGPGTEIGPFPMSDGDHIDIDAGGGSVATTFNGTPASVNNAPMVEPFVLAGGEVLEVRVNGVLQYVTFLPTDFVAPGAATALEVAHRVNSDIVNAKCKLTGAAPGPYGLEIETDGAGTDYSIETPGGTALPLLGFAPGLVIGGGNVGNIAAVTGLEAEALIEAAHAGPNAVDVTVNVTGTLTVETVGTGSAESIQLQGTSTVDFGLDYLPHVGTDSTPENTLLVEGKTPGSYTDAITTQVENATNGEAAYFNFKVLKDGAVKETFPNVTMDSSSDDWIETRVNNVNYGSDLVAVTDQLLPYVALLKRPANGTSAALVGGDDGLVGLVDADYLGNEAGPTGLYCFDVVKSGRILIVPGVYTPAVHKGMLDYAEIHRNGSMFCVLDCPPQQTAAQVVTYVETTAAILEYSEFGAIYWPWLKITNPQTSVFGSDNAITVAPSGWIAGKYAANDQRIGGIYESPAGIGGNWGVLRGVLGVEDDPSGSSVHEVEDERKRDLIYPKRINPITRLPGTPWHIDGGRTLKSTGNFPNVGERRGVIFIEQTIADSMIIFKHRHNNKETRRQVKRVVTVFLVQEMNKGAFRSTYADEAFFVDVSDQLNPTANEFAGILTLRIGLATNKPAEYIVVLVTQDTRALEESIAA